MQDLGEAVLNMRPIAEELADGSIWWYHHEAGSDPGKLSVYEKHALRQRKAGMRCKEEEEEHWQLKTDKAHV